MKLTLDIPDATLALIWEDTWGDKEPEPISERVLRKLEAEAAHYRRCFPECDPEGLMARFLASKALNQTKP